MSAEQPMHVADADLPAADEAQTGANAPAVADVNGVSVADVNGVSDLALRSALEFAVGIAAAGQKLRPPLVYPVGLKAYLKFSRLDRTSLRAVRRAVAGDESFRSRLGVVATTDLVDEIGMTWLQRRPGWEEHVRGLQAASDQEAEQKSSVAALRKAERRREAAEQAAARSAAELLGHHDTLAREQARRERAEAAVNAATAQSASLRNEVEGLRREMDKIKRRVAGEVERAERAEQALRETAEQLRIAEAMRDDVLARLAHREAADTGPGRASAAPVVSTVLTSAGNQVAARALAQAATATRELAEALTAAGRALAEPADVNEHDLPIASTAAPRTSHVTGVRHSGDHLAGVRPLRPRPAVRKPIAIPGGVYGDSIAAAHHLLRTPDAVILVDGYNVAKLGWPTMELLDQRELCIEMLEDLARRLGVDLRVVFDGADVVGASARRRLIRVQFSPPGVSADDVIRAEVRALPIGTPVVVVTNDQAIIADVRSDGANPVSSDMLLVACGRSATR